MNDSVHTGAMVALLVPNPSLYALPTELEDPRAVPAEDLHLTLVYLGESSEISQAEREQIVAAAQTLAETSREVTALFPAAQGTFPPDPESISPEQLENWEAPFYITPSNPELFNQLREDLVAHLSARGVAHRVSTKHPVFSPHVTLTYAPLTQPPVFDLPTPYPTTFSTILVKFGEETHTFPLIPDTPSADTPPLTASARAEISRLSKITHRSPEYLTSLYLKQATSPTRTESAQVQALNSLRKLFSLTPSHDPRAVTLYQRALLEADPTRQVFLCNRALAILNETPAPKDPNHARQQDALIASLTALIAAADFWFMRRGKAVWQPRDGKGRWIEMGRGVRFAFINPETGKKEWKYGTNVGTDPKRGKVHVELEDGRVVAVDPKLLDQPKAIIGLKRGEKAQRLLAKAVQRRRSNAEQDPNKESNDAAIEALESFQKKNESKASEPTSGAHLVHAATSQEARDAVTKAKADQLPEDSPLTYDAPNRKPFKDQKLEATLGELEAIQTEFDKHLNNALPSQEALDQMSEDDRKKAQQAAYQDAIRNLAGGFNERADEDARELRRTPALREDTLEEVTEEDAAAASEGPTKDELKELADKMAEEFASSIADDSSFASPRDLLVDDIKKDAEAFYSGELSAEEYADQLSKASHAASRYEPEGQTPSDEEESFGNLSEALEDLRDLVDIYKGSDADPEGEGEDFQPPSEEQEDALDPSDPEIEDEEKSYAEVAEEALSALQEASAAFVDGHEESEGIDNAVAVQSDAIDAWSASDWDDDNLPALADNILESSKALADEGTDEELIQDLVAKAEAFQEASNEAYDAAVDAPQESDGPEESEDELAVTQEEFADAYEDFSKRDVSDASAEAKDTYASVTNSLGNLSNGLENGTFDPEEALEALRTSATELDTLLNDNPESLRDAEDDFSELSDEVTRLADKLESHGYRYLDGEAEDASPVEDEPEVEDAPETPESVAPAPEGEGDGSRGPDEDGLGKARREHPELFSTDDFSSQDLLDEAVEELKFVHGESTVPADDPDFQEALAELSDARDLLQNNPDLTDAEVEQLHKNVSDAISEFLARPEISSLDDEITSRLSAHRYAHADRVETKNADADASELDGKIAELKEKLPEPELIEEILPEIHADFMESILKFDLPDTDPNSTDDLDDFEPVDLDSLEIDPLKDAKDAQRRYLDALEREEAKPEATEDAKDLIAGEKDRVQEAIETLEAEEQKQVEETLDPTPEQVSSEEVQSVIDALRSDSANPMAKFMADGLESNLNDGNPITKEELQQLADMFSIVANAPSTNEEDSSDASAVAEHLQAPQQQSAPEAPTPEADSEEVPSSADQTPTPDPEPEPEPEPATSEITPDVVDQDQEQAAADSVDFDAYNDSIKEFLETAGVSQNAGATPQNLSTHTPLEDNQRVVLDNLIKILPDSKPLDALISVYQSHLDGNATDENLVSALLEVLEDDSFPPNMRATMKDLISGVQVLGKNRVPILRPKKNFYEDDESEAESDFYLASPLVLYKQLSKILEQNLEGTDLNSLLQGDKSVSNNTEIAQHIADAKELVGGALSAFHSGDSELMASRMRDALDKFDAAIQLHKASGGGQQNKFIRRLRARRRALDEVLSAFEGRWADPVVKGKSLGSHGGFLYDTDIAAKDALGNDFYPGDVVGRKTGAISLVLATLNRKGDNRVHLWNAGYADSDDAGSSRNNVFLLAVGPNNPKYHDPNYTGPRVDDEVPQELNWDYVQHYKDENGKQKKRHVFESETLEGKLWGGESDTQAILKDKVDKAKKKIEAMGKASTKKEVDQAISESNSPEPQPEPASTPPTNVFEVLPSYMRGESGDGYAPNSSFWGKFGAAGIAVVATDENGKKHVLLGKRGDSNTWQLPGGAIDELESPVQGASREFSEEIVGGKDLLENLTYVSEHEFDPQHPSGWKYTNIVAEYNGDGEGLPELSPPSNAPSYELTEFKWVDAEELAQMEADGTLRDALSDDHLLADITGLSGGAPEPSTTHEVPVESLESLVGESVEDLSTPAYDISGWTHLGSAGGHSGAGAQIYQDSVGKRYVVKKPANPEQAHSEVLAAALYEALGAPVAKVRLGKNGDSDDVYVVSEWVNGAQQNLLEKITSGDSEYLDKIRKDFAVDAFLGNYDAIGGDFENIQSDAEGNPVRIDTGGSLAFKASGYEKPWWGPDVVELDEMRDPKNNISWVFNKAAQVFGGMSDEDVAESAKALLNITSRQIKKIVNSSGLPEDQKQSLIDTLIKRRHDILSKTGLVAGPENPDNSKDQILTEKKAVPEKSSNFSPGDKVSFTDAEGNTHEGTVEKEYPSGDLSVEVDGFFKVIKPSQVHLTQDHIPNSLTLNSGEQVKAGEKVWALDHSTGSWKELAVSSASPIELSTGDVKATLVDDSNPAEPKTHLVLLSDIISDVEYQELKQDSDNPPAPAPAPAPETATVTGFDGSEISIGSLVFNKTGSQSGTVVAFLPNGNVKFHKNDADGKPAYDSNGKPKYGNYTPARLKSVKMPKVSNDADESHPLYGTEEPTPPTPPKDLGISYVSDAWMEKANQQYQARKISLGKPTKDFTQSDFYTTKYLPIQNDGDTSQLEYLRSNGYIDDDLYNDALESIFKNKSSVQEAQEKYSQELADYIEQKKEWNKAHGITGFSDPNVLEPTAEEFKGGEADWTKAPVGTPSASTVLSSMKVADPELAYHGAWFAADKDSIEDLSVKVRKVVDSDSEYKLELKFKLTAWAGDKLMDEIFSKDGVVSVPSPTFKEMSTNAEGYPRIPSDSESHNKIGDASGVFHYSGSKISWTDPDTGVRVEFYRDSDSKTEASSTSLNNQVVVYVPEGIDNPEKTFQKVLEELGVDSNNATPPTKDAITSYKENKLMAVLGGHLDPTINPTGSEKDSILKSIQDKYGVTVDDVVFGMDARGQLKLKLSPSATEKIRTAIGSSYLFHKGYVFESASETFDLLFANNYGTTSTLENYIEGKKAKKGHLNSKNADMNVGGANGTFFYPSNSGSLMEDTTSLPDGIFVHPSTIASSLDFYATPGDYYGKVSSASELVPLLSAGNGQVIKKGGVTLEDIWFLKVPANVRSQLIDMLHQRGVATINNVAIEEFILSGTMPVPPKGV